MGKHKKIECRICLKTMRSDNLKKHMQKHEKKPPLKEVTPPQKEVCEKIEYHSKVDKVALENKLVNNSNEFMRKLELGRDIKEIIIKRSIMEASLSAEDREALELFEKHGQVKDVQPVEWRHWQKGLLEYINNPTPRRVIWVVGRKGNEGKSFFQDRIEEQYGMHRVCVMDFTESARNLLDCMRQEVDIITTDIFSFNIERVVHMGNIEYKLLEKIKDGRAVVGKYKTKKMRFKKTNVVMVFSNDYPDTGKLSPDRWLIFKINSEMQLEDVTEAKLKKKMGGGICKQEWKQYLYPEEL